MSNYDKMITTLVSMKDVLEKSWDRQFEDGDIRYTADKQHVMNIIFNYVSVITLLKDTTNHLEV